MPSSPGTRAAPAPRAFRSQAAFRAWLARHHATAPELLVRLFKTDFAHRGLTYAQALDEALCHGWIDGVRRRWDAESFTIRFTPRKPRSIWSRVNIAHVERLIAAENFTLHGLKGAGASLHDLANIRVYLKRPGDLTRCQAICERRFGAVPAIYAVADICRPELLVEIEGVSFSRLAPR